MRIKDTLSSLALIIMDLSAFFISFWFAVYSSNVITIILDDAHDFSSVSSYVIPYWWMPFVFLLSFAYHRFYQKRLSFWDEAREFVRAITLSIITIYAVIALGNISMSFSKIVMVFLWMYSILLFPMFRLVGKNLLFKTGALKKNVIIIGAGNAGIEVAKGILKESHFGYDIIGFLDDNYRIIGKEIVLNGNKYKIFGHIKHFKRFVKFLDIDTVVIAMPSQPKEILCNITGNVQRYVKNILFVPEMKGIALSNTELHHLFMEQLLLLKINNNLKSVANRSIKIAFDLILSLCCLPFILIIICILGILIKMDSRGPIFYSHARLGQNGKTIRVYKFRSMYQDSNERLSHILKNDEKSKKEWEKYYKLKNDPRITRVGNFLRKTSLDELPQIFNVLKLEMSLVGPRPVIREEINKYYRSNADYYFLVKPGMTGLWQVSGRNDTSYDFRVNLDTWYVLNWSMWLDIVILFKTVKVVFNTNGAY